MPRHLRVQRTPVRVELKMPMDTLTCVSERLDVLCPGEASAVAAVTHAASDQALRDPEQANETGRDDQQSQGSSGESGN